MRTIRYWCTEGRGERGERGGREEGRCLVKPFERRREGVGCVLFYYFFVFVFVAEFNPIEVSFIILVDRR